MKHQDKKLIKPIKANFLFLTEMSPKGLQTHKLETKCKSSVRACIMEKPAVDLQGKGAYISLSKVLEEQKPRENPEEIWNKVIYFCFVSAWSKIDNFLFAKYLSVYRL